MPIRSVAFALALAACGGPAEPCPPPPAPSTAGAEPTPARAPFEVPLADYRAGLMSVEVEVGGETRTMLFDTGAGLTAISPAVAEAIGCAPYGRLTGHRQTDERIDMPLCADVPLRVGPHRVRMDAVGVLDVGGLLPPEWPAVDGVVGLNAFAGERVTLDLACRRLTVDAAAPSGARPARMRLSRETDGVSLGVLLAARTGREGVRAWLQVDSGNTGPVLVAEHMAELLSVEQGAGQRLDLAGFGQVETEVAVMDLIHDGNLGAPLLSGYALWLDLDEETAAVAPTACPEPARDGADPSL